MSSLTLRPTAPCRRQHDLLLDPSSENGAPSRWQKTGDKSAHLNQASPLKSANLLHKHVAASPAPSVTHAPSTGCYLQTRSCPVPRIEHKKKVGNMRNRACALSKYNKASVLCCAVRGFSQTRTAQQSPQLLLCPLVTFIMLISVLRQVWQNEGAAFLCWVSMSAGSSHNDGGEIWSEGLQVS